MKDMETIKEIYAGMLEEHELALAEKRQERIKAANPYGCNQYGEGWKAPHNGKQSKVGEPAKKDSGEGEKKNPEKKEKKEEKAAPKFSDYKESMAEALLEAIERSDYLGYSTSVFFDGKKFTTRDNNGGLTIFDPNDIMELKKELEISGFDSMREAVFSYVDSFGQEHFDDIDFNYFKK